VREKAAIYSCDDDRATALRSRHSPLSRQFFQQHLGLLQVFGVKPFGKPIVNLGQHLPSFFSFTLLLPQLLAIQYRCIIDFKAPGIINDLKGERANRSKEAP
jgi:hypothetical protein